jgi:hypothetical protein
MADPNCRTVETHTRHQVFAWRAVGAHERFAEVGAVTGQPAGN